MKKLLKSLKRLKISVRAEYEKGMALVIPTIGIAWDGGLSIGILWGPWSAHINFDIKQPDI